MTTAKHADGLWTATVYIGPVIENPKAFREMGEVDGADSQGDAEAAGREQHNIGVGRAPAADLIPRMLPIVLFDVSRINASV